MAIAPLSMVLAVASPGQSGSDDCVNACRSDEVASVGMASVDAVKPSEDRLAMMLKAS